MDGIALVEEGCGAGHSTRTYLRAFFFIFCEGKGSIAYCTALASGISLTGALFIPLKGTASTEAATQNRIEIFYIKIFHKRALKSMHNLMAISFVICVEELSQG